MASNKYDDEEAIVENGSAIASAPEAGRVPVKFENEPELPKENAKYELLLELTGRGSANARLAADIVMVLDVSYSMKGDKLKEMKRAMQFVISKLSPSDRLSVCTFAKDSIKLCGLRVMSPVAKEKVDYMVQNLQVDYYTNISAGLQMALKVLDDRKYTTGRAGAIMLMSDGEQNVDDATKILVDRYPIYTFGFGDEKEIDTKVLGHIASKSKGGTFSVAKLGDLSKLFAPCLAGLLSVLVKDVNLVIKPLLGTVSRREKVKTIIEKVSAGDYEQIVDKETGVVTVSFGDLYQKEIRMVLVFLSLPEIRNDPNKAQVELDSLLSCTYRAESGNSTQTNPVKFRVKRCIAPKMKQTDATKAEIKRVEIVELMKEARTLAEAKNMDAALDKVVEGQNSLGHVVVEALNEESKMVIETLKYEVDEMVKFMQTNETYENKGRCFTYSSEISHDRQRFASRGDVEKIRSYATPRMETCFEQAKEFEKDPSKPVPTVVEDERTEIAADPLATVAPSLDYYLQIAIDALKNLQKVINYKA
ncbi:uncharacterized protein LOC110720875 [Chenopodium quinoa]|uniref:uncharacterized protein LOC110720875 n=1 Tax=Chenopodium quinoa TaxID=63459 RepID=UPI000B76D614|nr:uncharacterized protein LOC110720875 [Chenopodium quinoa]